MANHTITAALIASVAICQLGWAKICAISALIGPGGQATDQPIISPFIRLLSVIVLSGLILR